MILYAGRATAHEFPALNITGAHFPSSGAAQAASEGRIEAQDLNLRAGLRPAALLESIPGMVVTQHSGSGKANQYFLRGMNLDHGTDFATTLNGVPINLPSHAHGHGYSDLNVLMPELVWHVDYRKGPYFASEGDFSSAGSAHVVYRHQLDRPLLDWSMGQGGYLRGLAASSQSLGETRHLLMAVERLNHEGPWSTPEGLRKLNSQFILSGGSPREGWSASLSNYRARWTATDQIPQRLIDAGTYQGKPFGRFDSLDPSSGAHTQRSSVSGQWHRSSPNARSRVDAYAIRYELDLFSNFTYQLERANDQFAQSDRRTAWGAHAQHTWLASVGEHFEVLQTLGIQWRADRIQAGLFDSEYRQRQATVREDAIAQSLLGVYAESDITWTSGVRSVVGWRLDQYQARVDSALQALNSGRSAAVRGSPKLSLILGPWRDATFFINSGEGFHSNDARGTTTRVDPRSGEPITPVPGLVRSRGQEWGVEAPVTAHWQTALALWQLDFDSELVYVGDAGNTQAGRPSRRTGVEWRHHWQNQRPWRIDANFAWTRPRYVDADPSGPFIVNAVQRVARVVLAYDAQGPWAGSLVLRHIGSAPLVEDNTIRAEPSTTLYLRLSRQFTPDVGMTLDVLNLTDRRYHDMRYVYTSRLSGEPVAGVRDVHGHAAEPRTWRVAVRMRF